MGHNCSVAEISSTPVHCPVLSQVGLRYLINTTSADKVFLYFSLVPFSSLLQRDCCGFWHEMQPSRHQGQCCWLHTSRLVLAINNTAPRFLLSVSLPSGDIALFSDLGHHYSYCAPVPLRPKGALPQDTGLPLTEAIMIAWLCWHATLGCHLLERSVSSVCCVSALPSMWQNTVCTAFWPCLGEVSLLTSIHNFFIRLQKEYTSYFHFLFKIN